MELKLFGLLSFDFSFGQLVWARNGIGEDCMHSESEHPVFDTYRFHLFITDYHFELIKLKCHPFLSRIQSTSLRHFQHQQQFY